MSGSLDALCPSRPDNPTQPLHTTSADLAGTLRGSVDFGYEWLNGKSTLSQSEVGLPFMGRHEWESPHYPTAYIKGCGWVGFTLW